MGEIMLAYVAQPGGLVSIGLAFIFMFLFYVFAKAQIRGRLDWLDLIVRTGSTKVSLSKVLQLVGGITATWVIVKSTVMASGAISWELFTAYLTYVGSVEAYSKYMAQKRTDSPISSDSDSEIPSKSKD